jgi:hypothetical protein
MALPEGVKVFSEADVPQGSPAWHSLRCGVLTGSRCSPVLVDESKKPSAGKANLLTELVVERCTGQTTKAQTFGAATEAVMAQGLEREPDAIRRFESETLQVVRRVGFVYWVGKRAGCSPDGVLGDFDELVSIKCRDLKAHYEHIRRGTIPADARRQMAHEMWVTNARKHHYVSFNPSFERRLQFAHVELTRAELDVDGYARAAEGFLREVETEVQVMQQLAAGNEATLAAAVEVVNG